MIDFSSKIALPDRKELEFFAKNCLSDWDFDSYKKHRLSNHSHKAPAKSILNQYKKRLSEISDAVSNKELQDYIEYLIESIDTKRAQEQPGIVIKDCSNFNFASTNHGIQLTAVEPINKKQKISEETQTSLFEPSHSPVRSPVDDLFNPTEERGNDKVIVLYDILKRPMITPLQIHNEIYRLGVKKMQGSLNQNEIELLEDIIRTMMPSSMAENLDLMSAKLILDLDLNNAGQVNALKLSLSRTVSLVNTLILNIFQHYIKSTRFWDAVKNSKINHMEKDFNRMDELLQTIINEGKDNEGMISFKSLRLSVVLKKAEALRSDNGEMLQALDIIELVIQNATRKKSDSDSEISSYRKAAAILDILLQDSFISLVDGETTCKTSKNIAKHHEDIFGSNIPLSRGFGRRIDLLLSANNVEMSTNEWKRKSATKEQCLTQQIKNIRMNKAILSKLHELPLEINEPHLYTLGMDWIGQRGYMVSIQKTDNIYIARHKCNLMIPECLEQLPLFINTMKELYNWKDHHIKLKEIIIKAYYEKENTNFFSGIADGENEIVQKPISPNIYLTPIKSKHK
ncbi:hypothetical protein BD560DRAFT_388260 [Blakeslea trispora]|nr:hypothetical protein BD560DRAFT_388260 [Blakeslea trispora]